MDKIAKILLLSLSFISLSTYADNKLNAPLGLTWGVDEKTLTVDYSAKELAETSGKFRFSDAERVSLFEIEKPPLSLPGFNKVKGLVDKKYGLFAVYLVKSITDDDFGVEGKDSFYDIKEKISAKYGKPSVEDNSILNLNKDKDFYSCISSYSCGNFYATYLVGNNEGIAIKLFGKTKGTGELLVMYENSDGKRVFDEFQKEQELLLNKAL